MADIAAETVYALEVAGQPVLMFQAMSHQEARGLPREQWLRDDLREVHSNGAPVWDGKAKLTVRRANLDEAARFSETIVGAADDSGDLVLVYLIELDA
jgi:hypothetical protein